MTRLNLFLGLSLVGTVLFGALLSFLWLPYDPNAIDFAVKLQPPSPQHPLGTDNFGRDLLSRLMVGARGTLLVGFVAVGIALSVGCLLGALAGYGGGLFDEALMRLVDVLYAFPPILMAILLAAVFEPSTLTAMSAIGIATVPVFARIMRSSVLSLKSRDFVEAGRALGARDRGGVGAAYPAQRGLPHHRPGESQPSSRRAGRSGSLFFGSRHAAAHAELGEHAPRGAGVSGVEPLPRARAGSGYHRHGSRLEFARRWAERPTRPASEGDVSV